MTILIKAAIYIINFYSMFILLRFFMQYFRVDFYNPVSQSVVKLTNPLLLPLRKVIPGYGGYDFASLLLAYILGGVVLSLVFGFWASVSINTLFPILLLFLLQLAYSAVNLFFFLIILRIILSFVMMGQGFSRNPFADIIIQVTEPIMAPFQRVIPPVGVLDFSPIVVFFLIMLTKEGLIYTAKLINPMFFLI